MPSPSPGGRRTKARTKVILWGVDSTRDESDIKWTSAGKAGGVSRFCVLWAGRQRVEYDLRGRPDRRLRGALTAWLSDTSQQEPIWETSPTRNCGYLPKSCVNSGSALSTAVFLCSSRISCVPGTRLLWTSAFLRCSDEVAGN